MDNLQDANYHIIILEAELFLVRNELNDVYSPSIAWGKATEIVCDLISDTLAYIEKNGRTDKAERNKKKLIDLMQQTEIINQIASSNISLKLYNKSLFNENWRLKKELEEIKRQENLGNSL